MVIQLTKIVLCYQLPGTGTDGAASRTRTWTWEDLGGGSDMATADTMWTSSPSLMWSNRVESPSDQGHFNNQTWFKNAYGTQIYPPEESGSIVRKYKAYWSTIEPKGKLLMHDLNGDPVSVDVNGLDELGASLMNTIDFHACYAKRYFKFLTGEDIPLFPDFDTDNELINPHRYGGLLTLTQLQKYEKIKQWGLQLKNNQTNLKGVIVKIIESSYFLESEEGILPSLLEPTSLALLEEPEPEPVANSDEEELDEEQQLDDGPEEDTSYEEEVNIVQVSSSDLMDVFERNQCSMCHSGILDVGWLDGSADLPNMFKEGVTYLSQDDLCDSYLYTVLDPSEYPESPCNHEPDVFSWDPNSSAYMPQNNNALSREDMETIELYIIQRIEGN